MKICITCEGVSETDQTRCAHCGTVLVDTEEVHFPIRRGETDAANPLLGKVLDAKYRLLNVLGRGGMGTVFRAMHEVSLAPVAIKVLHPRFAASPTYRNGFLSEARKVGRVVHDNVARIQDVGEADDGTVYLAMELVDGVTFGEWMTGGRRVAPAIAVEVLEQTARALDVAHRAGIVHRDLSPRNVMVAVRDGRPVIKILDFGIAAGALSETVQRRDGGVGARADAAGAAPAGFANPPYSAPEHLEGAASDARSDLYSLGVIAYEALSGELPVRGATARELAQATLEGVVRPLPGLPGVPKALARLVDSLLSFAPADRPTDAAAVIAELQAVRRAPGRVLRPVAWTAFASTVLATAVVFAGTDAPRPFLSPKPGAALRLSRTPLEPGPAVVLHSRELAALRFDYTGFDASQLVVEVSARGRPTQRLSLDARVDRERGELLLTTENPSYRRLLDAWRTASRDGPLELRFGVPGQPPLGYARLRVDDDAPRSAWSHAEDGAEVEALDAVRSLDDVRIRVEEAGELTELRLLLREAGDAERALTAPSNLLATLATQRELSLADWPGLAARFDGVDSHGPVRFVVEATDAAGNRATSAPLVVQRVDLGVPRILDVTAPSGLEIVVFDAAGARVRLALSDVEDGLHVDVEAPDGERSSYDAPQRVGQGLELLLRPPANGGQFPDGVWRFRVRDAAGNASEATVATLTFRSRDPGLRLRVGDDGGGGTYLAVELGEFVGDGRPGRLVLDSSPLYELAGCELVAEGREPIAASVARAAPGRAEIAVPELADGDYALRLQLVDRRGGAPETADRFRLTIAREAPRLELPETDSRWLAALVDDGLFAIDSDGLRVGAAWRWARPDSIDLVRGRVWIGDDESANPVRIERASARRQEPLFRGVPLQRGVTVVALELVDVLGRPVEVRRGGRALAAANGRVRVARFWQHDAPLTTREPVVRVEYRRDARLELVSALPFVSDDVRLQIGGADVIPTAVETVGDETLLSFSLPFGLVVAGADLARLGEAEFATAEPAPLRALARTAAGDFALDLVVQTIRSSLVPVRGAELGGGGGVPPADALGALAFVPVLGPGVGVVFPDPVPSDVPRRAAFRPGPPTDVSGLRDFFVLDREITNAQYAAVVDAVASGTAFAALSPGDRAALVHAADPLGSRRCTVSGLARVVGADGGTVDVRSRAESEPDRAVTGVDFFQAWTVARLVGVLLGGDPALCRLPTGVELEVCAFGGGGGGGANRARGEVRLNGASRGDGVLRDRFRSRSANGPAPAPTAADCRAAGDVVATELGADVFGVDFGVREWVVDLPGVTSSANAALLREWLGDHDRHLQLVDAFARGDTSGVPSGLAADLLRLGVVRGTAFGESRAIVDPGSGRSADRDRTERLSRYVPGVVRTLHVRRDGEGLLAGERDARLPRIGFRLVGGKRFVDAVRAKR